MNALREFIDRASEFITTASETIAAVLKDGTKRERTFLTDEDHSSKKKPTRKCKLCKEQHGLWKCENFKEMTANERWNAVMERKLCFTCLSNGHRGIMFLEQILWNKWVSVPPSSDASCTFGAEGEHIGAK